MNFLSKLSHIGKTPVKYHIQILIQSVSNLFNMRASEALIVSIERNNKIYTSAASLPENGVAKFNYVIQFPMTLYKHGNVYLEKLYKIIIYPADNTEKKKLMKAKFDLAEFAANLKNGNSEFTRVILLNSYNKNNSDSLLPSHLMGPDDNRPQIRLTIRIVGLGEDGSIDNISEISENPEVSSENGNKVPEISSSKDIYNNISVRSPPKLPHNRGSFTQPVDITTSKSAKNNKNTFTEMVSENRDSDDFLRRQSMFRASIEKTPTNKKLLIDDRNNNSSPMLGTPHRLSAHGGLAGRMSVNSGIPSANKIAPIRLPANLPSEKKDDRHICINDDKDSTKLKVALATATSPTFNPEESSDSDSEIDDILLITPAPPKSAATANNNIENGKVLTAAEYDQITVIEGDMAPPPDWLKTPAPSQFRNRLNIDDLLTNEGGIRAKSEKTVLASNHSNNNMNLIPKNGHSLLKPTGHNKYVGNLDTSFQSNGSDHLETIDELPTGSAFPTPMTSPTFTKPSESKSVDVLTKLEDHKEFLNEVITPLKPTQTNKKRFKDKVNLSVQVTPISPSSIDSTPIAPPISIELESAEIEKPIKIKTPEIKSEPEKDVDSKNNPSSFNFDSASVADRKSSTAAALSSSLSPHPIPNTISPIKDVFKKDSNTFALTSKQNKRESMGSKAKPPSEIDVALLLQECVNTSPQPFWNDCVPTSACIIFRSIVHWRSNQESRKWIVSKVMEALNQKIRKIILDNSALGFWTTNIALLFHLVSHQHPLIKRPFSRDDEEIEILNYFSSQLKSSLLRVFQTLLSNYYSKLNELNLRKVLDEDEDLDSPMIESITEVFTDIYTLLVTEKCFSSLRDQFIRSLLSFVNSSLINIIVQNPQYCVMSTGVRIKIAISMLRQWSQEYMGNSFSTSVDRIFAPLMELCLILMNEKSSLKELNELGKMCQLLNPHQLERILINWNVNEINAYDIVSNEILEALQSSEALKSVPDVNPHLNPYEQPELVVDISIATFYLCDVTTPPNLAIQPLFKFLTREDLELTIN